jgi:hypothetical protein
MSCVSHDVVECCCCLYTWCVRARLCQHIVAICVRIHIILCSTGRSDTSHSQRFSWRAAADSCKAAKSGARKRTCVCEACWRFEDVLNNSHFAECVVRHVREVARLFASFDICSGCRWLACLSRVPSVRTWTLAAAGAAAAKAGLLGFQHGILPSAAVASNQCKGAASPHSRTCVASRSAPRRRGIRRHFLHCLH